MAFLPGTVQLVTEKKKGTRRKGLWTFEAMCNGNAFGQNAEPFRECIGIRGAHLREPVDFRVESCRGLEMSRISSAKAPTPLKGGAEETKGLRMQIGLRADQEMLWKTR